jgi:excinuclease UvrABC nuclease subunit
MGNFSFSISVKPKPIPFDFGDLTQFKKYESYSDLPCVEGVYLVFTQDMKCVYVGQSVNIQKRFKAGHLHCGKLRAMYDLGAKFFYVIPCGYSMKSHIEASAMHVFKPMLNIVPVCGYGVKHGNPF